MKLALKVGFALLLIPHQVLACPNLAGHYDYQGEDGVVHIAIHQTKCEMVKIDNMSGYGDGQNDPDSTTLVPDGKQHSSDMPTAEWIDDRLELTSGDEAGSYYAVNSAGNLRIGSSTEERKSLPQCVGKDLCEEIAQRTKAKN